MTYHTLFHRDGLFLVPSDALRPSIADGTRLWIDLLLESRRSLKQRNASRTHRLIIGYTPVIQPLTRISLMPLRGYTVSSRTVAIRAVLRLATHFSILEGDWT